MKAVAKSGETVDRDSSPTSDKRSDNDSDICSVLTANVPNK